MAIPIFEALSNCLDVTSPAGVNYVNDRWLTWNRDDGKGSDARLNNLMDEQEAATHPWPP